MRLLGSSEAKQIKDSEKLIVLKELQGLNTETANARKLLQELRTSFTQERTLIEAERSEMWLVLGEQKKVLKNELSELETKKRALEQSADAKRLKKITAEVTKLQNTLTLLQKETELEQAILLERQKELTTSLQAYTELTKTLEDRLEETKKLEDTLKTELTTVRSANLKEKRRLDKQVRDMESYRQHIEDRETNLGHRENGFRTLLSELATDRATLENDRVALKDAYAVLAKSRKEILGRDL